MSKEMLSRLIAEFDNDTVTAFILHGSYAQQKATRYSDVDLVRIVRETPERTQQKRYLYREDHLISLSTRTIEKYHELMERPESAIFVVPGLREAQILLDRDGTFKKLQEEANNFRWEPLQDIANYHISEMLMGQIEIAHKVLRAFLVDDELALAEMIHILISAVTDVIPVQRGLFITSGNTYYQQIYDAVGRLSTWTRYHRLLVGVDPSPLSLKAKGVLALRLYQSTVQMVSEALYPKYQAAIKQSVTIIDEALDTMAVKERLQFPNL